MRKRSRKLPVWLTVFAFSNPVFYVLFRVNKLETFDWGLLDEKVWCAVFVTMIIWLFYLLFCIRGHKGFFWR